MNTRKLIVNGLLVFLLLFVTLVFVSCEGSEAQKESKSAVANSQMYYTVKGKLVEVHNTPWGLQQYEVEELPPGAFGVEGGIFVEGEDDPRIKIVYLQEKGVVSVTVDGEEIPKKE